MKLNVTNHVTTWHGKYIVSTQDFSCWNLQQSLHSKQQKHFCSEPVSPLDDFCLMPSFSSFFNFFNFFNVVIIVIIIIIIIIISVHIHWCTNFCTSFHPVSVGCLLPMDAAIFGSSCHFRHPWPILPASQNQEPTWFCMAKSFFTLLQTWKKTLQEKTSLNITYPFQLSPFFWRLRVFCPWHRFHFLFVINSFSSEWVNYKTVPTSEKSCN